MHFMHSTFLKKTFYIRKKNTYIPDQASSDAYQGDLILSSFVIP